jgi:hypothetical protein
MYNNVRTFDFFSALYLGRAVCDLDSCVVLGYLSLLPEW